MAAVRRSDQALCEQVSTWESLDYGVAHWSEDCPELADGNQLRDVWLATMDGAAALAACDAFFGERGLTCQRWTPASGQAIEPVEAIMRQRGWRCVRSAAMGLRDWNAGESEAGGPSALTGLNLRVDEAVASLLHRRPASDATGETPVPPQGTAPPANPKSKGRRHTGGGDSIRVLPARAMKKAYRATFDGSRDAASAEAVRAGIARLDDPNYDSFVAMVGDVPAGRAAYLEVGDIARLADVFVLPEFRRRGVGRALAARFAQLARRLTPRVAVASCDCEDAAAVAFLERCGFAAVGTLTAFDRPAE